MGCRLIVDGLSLRDTDLQKLRDEMTGLQELAPYNASILCRLNWNGSDHVGILTVKSMAEDFVSVCVGGEIRGTVERLFEDLRKKLFIWSRSRF
jgi:hypothetical protein